MKYFHIASLILICFFAFSCRKDPPAPSAGQEPKFKAPNCPQPPDPITDTNMLACKYKPGTFWVFKDSVSIRLDTMFVEKVTTCDKCVSMNQPADPCYPETFSLDISFKHDTDFVLNSLSYSLQDFGFVLGSPFFWKVGGQAIPLLYKGATLYVSEKTASTFKLHDSLFIGDRYYKKVFETYAVQFTNAEGTRMYYQSIKTFFNPQYGFLQFEFRNRLTQQLTGRRTVVSRNIVR